MSDHLDLDTLADVLAGVAAPEHLDTCASCRARLTELAAAEPATRQALAAVPPAAEPPDLANRLAAALAQAREEQQPAVPVGDVVPLAPPARRTALWWKAAAGVAAAALLVTGAVVLTRGGGHGTSTTQAGRGTGYAVNVSGTDYGNAAALQRALPALLAGKATKAAPATPFSGTGATGELSGTAAAGTAPRPSSSERLTPGTVSGLVPAADPLARLHTTPGLADCIAALTDPQPQLPLALDYAQYKGQPALVVVLPSTKADKVDVFVVGAGCSQADAKVLLFARLPKP